MNSNIYMHIYRHLSFENLKTVVFLCDLFPFINSCYPVIYLVSGHLTVVRTICSDKVLLKHSIMEIEETTWKQYFYLLLLT